MSDLVTRAQLVLLARTLHVAPERLTHLRRLGAEQLHELQQRMAAVTFERHGETFGRISKLVPIIPLTISMPLVQRLVPPMMTGRAAGAVGADHPKKAADTIALLGTTYAADCAIYVDPRTFGEIADVAPPVPIIEILNETIRRGDYITAGPFLAYATPRLIEAIEHGVTDDAGLIYSAAYAYSAASISAIMRQLLSGTQQRFPRLVRTVLAGPPELQSAALSVFVRCDSDVLRQIGDVLFGLGSAPAIGHLVMTAIRTGTVGELLTFTSHLSQPALGRMAANPVLADEAVQDALIQALGSRTGAEGWRGLFLLTARLPAGRRGQVAGLLAELPDATIAHLPSVASEADLWPHLLQLIAIGDTDVQTRIGAVWATLPPERRALVRRHIQEQWLETPLATIIAAVPEMSVAEMLDRRRHTRRRSADGWD